MNTAWQVPVSWQGVSRPRAHWLQVSRATDKLVPAACGAEFNPGFAVQVPDYPTSVHVTPCARCQRARQK